MFAEIGLAISAVKIANEAIGELKIMCGNLGEIKSIGCMGKSVTKLIDAQDEIKKKADEGDIDSFFALEKIRTERENLKRLMIYGGRPHLYEDFLKFERTRRELREKEAKRELARKLAKRKAIKDGLIITTAVLAGCLVVGLGIWLLLAIISMRGR